MMYNDKNNQDAIIKILQIGKVNGIDSISLHDLRLVLENYEINLPQTLIDVTVRKMVKSGRLIESNGEYSLSDDPSNNVPDTILGLPIVYTDKGFVDTDKEFPIVLGTLDEYIVNAPEETPYKDNYDKN